MDTSLAMALRITLETVTATVATRIPVLAGVGVSVGGGAQPQDASVMGRSAALRICMCRGRVRTNGPFTRRACDRTGPQSTLEVRCGRG